MRKVYDNYDYEEAYQKQVESLEEWEIERLLKEGRVDCLYRTTTIKTKNIKSGTEILESMVYPSYKNRVDMPKTKKKRETKPSQKNLNDRNSRRYMIRLACINFGEGDIWGTFGWDEGNMPDDIEGAKKDIRNFIGRVNYRRKKEGKGNAKYIYILAFDEYVRPHFHILISGDGMEELWTKCKRKNTRRIKPDDDFLITGLATYISNNPHGTKRWCSSKNLKKPSAPIRSYKKITRRKANNMAKDHEALKEGMEKAYPGYTFLDAEVKYNGQTAAFYIYARMVKRAEKKKEKRRRE